MWYSRPIRSVFTTQFAAVLVAFVAAVFSTPALDSFDFEIPSGCKECLLRDALAHKLAGQTEHIPPANRSLPAACSP